MLPIARGEGTRGIATGSVATERQAQAVLDWLAARAPDSGGDADDAAWLADFRARTALIGRLLSPEPVHAVEHRTIGGVPVRFYRPAERTPGTLFHLHGGGAIAGTLDGHDPALRRLALRTGWTVAAPEFRLAPEARFPAQMDEARAALAGVEGRVVLSGDSIGATLATALAREVGAAGQVLLYPNTDLRRGADYPSRRGEDGRIIDAAGLERQIGLYLADESQRDDPRASPILADVAGLPPAFVATAEHDPLRDEGEAYAERLRAGGVEVEHHRYAGALHAFLQMELPAAEVMLGRLRGWLDRL